MQTRRDRLQAYRFGSRRLVASLMAGDPDAPEAPLRRIAGAVLAGVLLGALAVAGVGVYGALNPGGSTTWRDGRSLIVEKETNTRYVYLAGVLHPVLNLGSARLILGQSDLAVARVARASLSGTPRGLPVGIPGAPDALPSPKSLITSAWTVCAEPARTPSGAAVPYTRVVLGTRPAGLTAVPADRALLVGGVDGTSYLIWGGHRMRIRSSSVLPALGWSASEVVPVGAAWLDAVPAGADLLPPAVPGRGSAGPAVAGAATRIGEVFSVSNVDVVNEYYVMLRDGLAPVSPLQAALLLGDPGTRRAYPSGPTAPVQVTAGVVASAPRSTTGAPAPAGYPTRVPRLVDVAASGTALCTVDNDPNAADPAATLFTRAAAPVTADPATVVDPVSRTPLADAVVVPPARGALVRAVPSPGVPDGTLYLVTDLGYKYPLASTQVPGMLGYQGVSPVPVAEGVLQALPSGPDLDPDAAGRTVSPAPAGN
jgi:type VII secretion protein EccB